MLHTTQTPSQASPLTNRPACQHSKLLTARQPRPYVCRPRMLTSSCASAANCSPEKQPAPQTIQQPFRSSDAGLPLDFRSMFDLGCQIGSGSFGQVYIATEKASGQQFAAKVVPQKRNGWSPRPGVSRVHEEVAILQQVQGCVEALHLHNVYEDTEHVVIVTELCLGGDLQAYLDARGRLREAEAAQAAHDILRVLEACHASGISYGDVKPANFLLRDHYPDPATPERRMRLRVADFGCSQQMVSKGARLQKQTGTPLYVAPEHFMRNSGLEADMWALGMLTYQLISGHLPFAESFAGRNPMEVMMAILSEDVEFKAPSWAHVSDDAKDLILRMLDRDYNSRISPSEALQHPWIEAFCAGEVCLASDIKEFPRSNSPDRRSFAAF